MARQLGIKYLENEMWSMEDYFSQEMTDLYLDTTVNTVIGQGQSKG